ncbi:MAG: aquaporin [Nocardioidaceae bacterium]
MSDAAVETSAPTLAQKLAAEVLGTFVLVVFGVGAAIMSGGDYVATGLSFGLAVLVMAYAVGRISGGHFNPAVSMGAAAGGRISWRDAGLYMVAQVVGAVVGAFVLWVLVHGVPELSRPDGLGQNAFGDAGNGFAWWAAFLIELVMTAIFITVILAVTDVRNEHPALAPLAIGLTLAVIHYASMGATGTSVNPARSIGPALFSGSGDAILQLWLFILAPLVGALAAGAAYHVVFGRADEPVTGSGLRFSRPAPQPAYPSDAYQQQWNQAYGQQQGYAAGYGGQQYATGQHQAWDQQTWQDSPQQSQSWEGQAWEGQQVQQPPQSPQAPQAQQPQSWEGQAWEGQGWEGQPQQWPQQPPQSATQQPWNQTQPFPPAPTEPYWSQQLPENWNDTGPEEDEGGQTQIRPPERS